ncbi:hypothetical protein RJ639_006577 [Escallonia herrerae]|uniref:RING-type E3 ubiquitin transferase n=1 Tax=Escallonia herrerae TaxID=1293975 RepID=A0AA89AV84_9ASTE|nr:hypothetical protein RJ639_006577 [Escallonia herrerae]
MGSGRHGWKISLIFHRSPSTDPKTRHQHAPPKEFVCPISNTLMADPVIVSSGHTFERSCVQACKSLSFTPTLPDSSTPDFSAVIPNLALKSTILNWCTTSLIDPPKPLDLLSAHNLILQLKSCKTKSLEEKTELTRWPSQCSSSSEESVGTTPTSITSSDVETLIYNSSEEKDIITKLKSCEVHEQEAALVSLRKMTRNEELPRVSLCTSGLLSALRSLITSKYASIQVNSVAALVNLSLEDKNKVKIVRSGIVPPLISVLRFGFAEAQDHAAGAIFSLALDDQNKSAIGVLGALSPLLHALRSDSDQARHDSALALFHLSLVQGNRTKLVKLGSVGVLLDVVRSGRMTSRVMLVLCNLAASLEGRPAMLDGGAVGCFVEMLSRNEFDAVATRESCVAALYGLSHGGLRFKGLAKEAGAEAVLTKVEEVGSERAREKVRRILEVVRGRDDEEGEEIDWEELLNSGEVSRSWFQLGCGMDVSGSKWNLADS